MSEQEKGLSLLGLAARARKVVSGEELVVKEVQQKRARLVVLSKDASDLTTKKIKDKTTFYKTPICYVEDRYVLGHAIGKDARVVVAITDQGFATKLQTLLN